MKLRVEAVWKYRGKGTGCNQWCSPMWTSAVDVVNPVAQRTRRILLIACLLTVPAVAWRGAGVAAAMAPDPVAAAWYPRGGGLWNDGRVYEGAPAISGTIPPSSTRSPTFA